MPKTALGGQQSWNFEIDAFERFEGLRNIQFTVTAAKFVKFLKQVCNKMKINYRPQKLSARYRLIENFVG